MAITAEKLIPTKTSSGSNGPKLKVKTISMKVNKINEILKGTLAAEKKQRDQERKSEERESSTKAENALEKEQKKNSKIKLPAPLKNLNPIDKIKNFLFNVLGGYIAVRLLDNLPLLQKLIPIIGGAMKFIEDWGGRILDGLVTLIDKGYEMYDGLRKKVGDFFGEDGQKKFDEISDVLKKVINGVLIAGMVGLAAARFNPLGGGRGGRGAGAGAGARPRPGQGFRPKVTTTGGGAAGRPDLRNPLRQRPTVTSGSGASRLGSRLAGRGASRVTTSAASRVGARAGLRAAGRLLKPILSKVPFIGGLLEFFLSWALGDPIGKAAFRGVGMTLGSWIGGLLGTLIPVPFVGTAIGAFLGGMGAAELAGLMYDAIFSGKQAVQAPGDNLDTKEELVRIIR